MRRFFILCGVYIYLAGCQMTPAPLCSGWRPPPRVNKPARLVKDEPNLSRWIVATDRFGRSEKCWE
ncbi:hypothetical protein [Bartonella sp. DGB2]|uniref:hypothetical protein n=1 Tax=Bartonella sp. DGB2 TaxID=3388426 RepID=UPI00398F9AD3